MEDMLAVEGQLEAPTDETKSVAAAESGAGYAETASAQGTESFYGSHKKSGTWKKFKKAFKTTHKDPEVKCVVAPADMLPPDAATNKQWSAWCN